MQTTYRLEGEGPLSLTCFEEVDKVFKAIQGAHFPNLSTIVERLSCGQSAAKQQLLEFHV